ncbi:50S ribosomal protein L16 [Candidatus Falkowbacteria bacterium RBG_13_39_14]|uniref:Large ribosomal subunit protein uL16 n=1 Tax=Candidatus Falkowbacteria bacterium RBG_13_39_14 TaxID=1797985 RepID=A0A1F5S3J3_9BACT|nr:MAG: 50S ribosomal protein L16 [Candidatus Falkowbacteria bacterium RBG_13_39_14]
MLSPKKTKYRKSFKGRRSGKGVAATQTKVDFGSFGMKAMTEGWITSRQIESARRVITKSFQKGGKIWIRLFPHKPVTKKGGEIGMGGGKGAVDHYVAVVKPGAILFELEGVDAAKAKSAMESAGHKLPIKVKFVEK